MTDPLTEPIGQQQSGQVAMFHVEPGTKFMRVEWPGGKPQAVNMSIEQFEALIEDFNAWRDLAEKQATALAGWSHNRRPPSPELLQAIEDLKIRLGVE